MKQIKLFLILLFSGFITQAQITGVKTIPGDYASMAAAFTDLNLQGVGAGGATFNVAAGYTENLSAALLLSITTNTPTESNPLIFQKSGVGANPLITAHTGVSLTVDGIIVLDGVDYVTFDGIDVQENVANVTATAQMEWGYALVKSSATNGSQHNTIKNAVITLNKLNTASVGIYSANHTSLVNTGLTISNASGTNSFNRFYNNTVQNTYIGIAILGFASAAPFDFYDQSNEIGIDGISPNPNQILNFGGGAITVNGINVTGQNKIKIFNTTINNTAAPTSTSTMNGISLTTGTNSNVDIYNNTITLTSQSITGSNLIGINNAIGASGAGNTVNIYNNTVTGCTYPTNTSGIFRAITSSVTATYTNIYNNTITNNTIPGSGEFSGIYYSGSSATLCLVVNINGNTISGNTKTGISGTMNCIYASASTATTNTFNNQVFNNNNATSSGALYGYYNFSFGYNETLYSNQFYNNTGGTGETVMMYVRSGSGPTNKEVYNNSIYNITGASTGAQVAAIFLDYGTLVNCYNNNIYNISNTTATGIVPTVAGIILGAQVNSQPTIYNNTISEIKAPNANNVNAIYGVWIQGSASTNAKIYYNTIYLNATSVGANFGTAGIVCATTPVNIDLRNNIVVNNSSFNGTGITRALVRASTVLTNYGLNSGYNCLHAGTPGANNLVFTDGTNNIQTLQLFKNLVGPREQSSFSEIPPFINVGVSPYDLHIQAGIATQCENGATPVASINTDIDGNARNINTPDVGADEFNGITTDIASPNIQYALLGNGDVAATRVCTGFATITDPSNINIAPGTNPRLYFKKSTNANTFNDNTSGTDGWKYVEASNAGSPFNFTINYALLFGGGGVIAGDLIQYFVTAQDLNAPPRIGLNNGGFTLQPASVNLAAANFPLTNTINQYLIVGTALSGVVTVPGTYPSLTNPGGLFEAINNGTVSGNITAQITADLLAETGTISLNQWSEIGTGNYTLSIVPSAAVQRTIAGASAVNALIRLTGADRVTIDGRFGGTGTWLTFRNTSNSAPTIGLLNDAKDNTITYSIIEGGNTNVTAGNQGGTINIGNTLATLFEGNDNNTISFCDIRDRSDVIGTSGIAIMSVGLNTGTINHYNHNLTISNNNIHDWFLLNSNSQFAISVGVGTSNYTITGNSFYQTLPRTNTLSGAITRAINISFASTVNSNGGFIITDNFIGGTAPGANGSDWVQTVAGVGVSQTMAGIIVTSGLIPNSIQNNTIRKIDFTTNAPAAAASVWLGIQGAQGIFNIGNIAGNTIGSGTGQDHIKLTINAGGAVSSFIAGIQFAGLAGYANIQNNTIGGITINGSTITGAIIPQWIQIQGTPSQTTTISNNLIGSLVTANSIRNLATAPPVIGFAVRQVITSGAGLVMNNNTIQNIQELSSSASTGYYGILLISSVGGTNQLSITNNTIKNLEVAAATGAPTLVNLGIAIQGMGGTNNVITGNNISGLFNSSAIASMGYAIGMQAQGSSFGATFSKNKIWDIRNASSSPSAGIAGMYLSAGLLWNISNNMISLDNTGYASDVQIWGINNFMSPASVTNLSYNSIYIGGTSFGANNSLGYLRNNSSILNAKNNIFYNERIGGFGSHFAIGSTNAVSAGLISDYNTFITADSTKVALWGLANNNLSTWQTSTGGDANSIANNNTGVTSAAMYVSAGAGDLHLNTSPFSVNRGQGGQAVTVDYDNENRASISPAMGADEKPCAGAPTAGTLSATNLGPVCVSLANDTLNLAGYSNASGIYFQYQSSTDGITFVNAGTPTSRPYYYTGALTDTMWYQVVVTCVNSGLSSTSNIIQINVSALPTVTASVTPATSVCLGTAITLTGGGAGVGATYTWTDGVNIPLDNTPYTPTATATYTVTGTNTAGCSSTASIAVTVNPVPPITTITAVSGTICQGDSSQLTMTPNYGDDYILSSTTFAPLVPSGLVTILADAGVAVTPQTMGSLDDGTWEAINLPFTFNYYGLPFTQFNVSTNGFITLGASLGNAFCCAGQVIPNAATPNNYIAIAHEDWLLTTTGTIDYFTNGVAPNRQFVVRFTAVPRFGGTGAPTTAQIILNETSNTVEMQATSITTASGDLTTMGIENGTGTKAVVVSGRNSTAPWTATNEAWLFTPNSPYGIVSWTPTNGLSNSTIFNPKASPAATTTYTATVVDAGGCSNSSIVTVTVSPAPTVSASASPTTICVGSSSTLTATGTAVTYTWNPGALVGAVQNVSPATTTTYTVVGVDGGGCTQSSVATVVVNQFNAGGVASELLYYKFDQVGASVTNQALTPPIGTGTATLMGGLTQGGIGQGGTALVGTGITATTDYVNTNWVTNLTGTSWSISFWTSNITPSATLFYIFGDASAGGFRCFTNGVAGATNWILRCTGMADISIPGGATVLPHLNTFVYDNVAGNLKGYRDGVLQTTVVTAAPTIAGTGPFKVGGYGANVGLPLGGLMDEFRLYNRALSPAEVLELLSLSSPFVATATPTTGCSGSQVTLDVSGTLNPYTWNPGALPGNNVIVNPLVTTVYTVTGTDGNGCTGTTTVNVNVNPLPTVTASPASQTICENAQATVNGGGALTYVWTGGISNGVPFTVTGANVYTVTGTDGNGCENTATAEVLMNAAPVINATATPGTTCNLTSVNPCATGAVSYVWTGGLTNCTPFVATTTDTYTVTGTDGAGCTGTSSVTVTVTPASGVLAPTTSNQSQDHGDDFNINYYAANCDLIATVDDGAGGNVLGLTTSTVNVDATASFHNGQPFVRRWYQITPTTNGSADVKLYINQTDFDDYNAAVVAPYLPLPTGPGDASGIANIRITKNDDGGLGNNPIVITPAVSWNGTYWELSFNTPSFSQFRVHSVNPGNVPLPVTVTSFSGTKLESSDKLSWITSSEQNNAYFNLQHSTDGISFSTIAKVSSKAPNGNSNTALSYTATNNKPALGHNYYRLQQVDIDNKVSVHAQIVDLIWGANGSTVSIYPNPTTDILNIDLYATSAQNTTVKLLDMSGRVIRQVQAKSAVGMNNIQLSLGEIASGVYTVQVYENNHLTHTSKVKKND
jgi:hypothetical protein